MNYLRALHEAHFLIIEPADPNLKLELTSFTGGCSGSNRRKLFNRYFHESTGVTCVHRIDPRHKTILGYTLKERIGAGGYGEVWSAEAPGGFAKAVKLVYGYHDEKRAQTELKAMDRIKQVRHPFLLSLERIEVLRRPVGCRQRVG